MRCFNCNANCQNGSSKCWNCGRVFNKRRFKVKNVNIQNNYYHNKNDDFYGDIALELAALVGGYLYLTKDKEK